MSILTGALAFLAYSLGALVAIPVVIFVAILIIIALGIAIIVVSFIILFIRNLCFMLYVKIKRRKDDGE